MNLTAEVTANAEVWIFLIAFIASISENHFDLSMYANVNEKIILVYIDSFLEKV
jgi:hypothetical protein